MAISFAADFASRQQAGQALKQVQQECAAVLRQELRQIKEF
ncbi:hypothetical protein [Rhizobium sp. 768_B6_N1_8]|jgi:hypothetical protein